MRSLLSEADAREVEGAIARVELVSGAELVVAVLPHSTEHWRGRVLVSVAWAMAAGLLVYELWPWSMHWLVLVLQLGVGLACFFALGFPPVHRWLVSPKAAQRAAHARAFQLFSERGLHATESRTALLVFVSELERRVVLLGDATIHRELGREGWQAETQKLVSHIRRGQLKQGLLEVIADLEPHLVKVAPRSVDDKNELPDAVVRG